MDISQVPMQWERSAKKIASHMSRLNPAIIHADFWPPNIKCIGNNIVGLMDFDDWAYGPAVFDLVVAFQECAMFGGSQINHLVAENILRGYFETGGRMSKIEVDLFPDAIELFCSLFLAYNIVQAETMPEAEIYLARLQRLADEKENAAFRNEVSELIAKTRIN